MNIIRKLTLRHIRSNLKRTAVTVFGIAASTALITAMIVGVYSGFSFVADVTLYADGNWHAVFKDLSEEEYRKLKEDPEITLAGVADTDNENTGFRIDGKKGLRFRTGNVYHGNADLLMQMVSCNYEGRLPENANEIAVEESFLKDNGLNLQTGDTLSFHRGYRYIYEGEQLTYLGGAYRSNEEFKELSEENCIITAILHGNHPTADFAILQGMEEETVPERNIVYITLKNPGVFSVDHIRTIAGRYGLSVRELNTEYFMSIFAFHIPNSAVAGIFRLLGIAMAIIIVASVIMIYNAFAMSLTERMKYLGMLSSVGATKRQKRASVFCEGFLLSLFGIPTGFGIGVLGCLVTLRAIGSLIIDAKIIRGINAGTDTIPVRVHPVIVLLILLFACFTVWLSSLVPALRASKVTPIDAIRQSTEIRLRAGRLRTLPFVKYIFGYEGEIALKNIKRNGARGVIITLSLAISFIMFLIISYFVDLFHKANNYDIEIPFQVFASAALDEKDRLREDLEGIEGVEKIYTAEMFCFDYSPVDENGQEREIPNPAILDEKYLTRDYKDLFRNIREIWVVPTDDDTFREILRRNNVSEEAYFGEELRGVLLNNTTHKKSRKPVFNDTILGQKLFWDKPKGNPPAVTIGDFVRFDADIDTYKLSPKGSISVYVPVSVYHREELKTLNPEELCCTYGIRCADHEKVTELVSRILEFDGYHNTLCSDMEDGLQVMKTLLTLLKTIMYGFTILISLIVISNIVNTISTGVQLRRKEFAMFKSVGMTERGFHRMLFLETFLYGFRALIIGIPVSVLLSYLMYISLYTKTVAFEINGGTYLFATLAVFAVVGTGMLLSANRLKGDTIIEVLKEDMC